MLAQFTKYPSPMFRLAMVWAIGKINDPGGVELLQQLKEDNSLLIRKKAQIALAAYEDGKPAMTGDDTATAPPEALPISRG